MANVQYYGTGRRKSSVARVRLVAGEGNIIVNGRAVEEYFNYETLIRDVKQPLVLTNNETKYDVIVKVEGGGFTGQAGAIRHGISRALLKADLDLRPALKAEGFLTRDARMKERKKYGLKGSKKSSTILKEIISFICSTKTLEYSKVFFNINIQGDIVRKYIKHIIFSSIAIILVTVSIFEIKSVSENVMEYMPVTNKTIILDAGHGGYIREYK